MSMSCRGVLISLFAILGSACVTADLGPATTVEIEDAPYDPDLWIDVVSEGSFSFVTMAIENRGDEAVGILAPAGTLLIGSDPREQDLVLAEDVSIVVAPGEVEEVRPATYCMQIERLPPSRGRAFTPQGWDWEIADLVRNAGPTGRAGLQDRVWNLTRARTTAR
jgi:hypothetical protein